MSDRDDIRTELEAKDAEKLRQEERATESLERLHGYDKTDADSFPASDPPSTMPGEHENEVANDEE